MSETPVHRTDRQRTQGETIILVVAAIASTIWVAALTTTMMGVFANYPVTLAPGMGLNAFFTYYVV
ncbi:MAG: hypothetical protein ACFNME_08045, partial [Actinomyces dentalis]